jgi:eukaryotic-like serine/threonine-protein kinase
MNSIRLEIGQSSIAGRKPRNDDSYGVVVPEGHVLESKGVAIAIADGMSSSEAAKEASECCVRSFLEDYYATHESWTVKRSVATVLKAVNAWLYAQGQRQDFDERGMVSTFSGLVLKSGKAHIFHAGDSRIWRLRGRALEQLTTDHRLRVGRGMEHLSRAFGINQNLEIDYRQEPLEVGDTFVLTTDGIHDTLTSQELSTFLTGDCQDASQKIIDASFVKGSTDNLTCQIVRVLETSSLDEQSHKAISANLPFPKLLTAGDKLDGFLIVRPIHESNRSQVYLATENTTGEIVAIKTPSPNFEDDLSYIEAFAREEWIGRLVSSPHALKIHELKFSRKYLYHVTEYFDGKTLQQWMLDNPMAELESVRQIIEQIAMGLRAMHRREILHLDLKPGNIMISAQGLVKIIDFGSSQVASWDDERTKSKLSIPAGTADYTAPENLLGQTPTNRADIYSLGAITYEMLTGRLPYGTGIVSASAIKRLSYVSANSHRKDIPDWLDAALEEAVQIEPNNRTEALSAFTTNLRTPNSALMPTHQRPLIERNPAAFWRGASIILFVMCIVLGFLASR